MYLAKIIKSVNHTYIYDALNNKFALLQSEEDIYNKDKYKTFWQRTISVILQNHANLISNIRIVKKN